MAIRSYSVENPSRGRYIVTWAGLLNGDSGEPLILSKACKSIRFNGTFGAGGTVIFEGSNDTSSPVFATLVDLQGNAISKTTAGIENVAVSVQQVRPRVTAGDGTTNLTAQILIEI